MENYLNKTIISENENDTLNIAHDFAKQLKPNDIIVLTGNLGAGKTKFVYGIAKFFAVENKVSSPTFTIVNEYLLDKKINEIEKINHFDVYRLESYIDFYDSVGTEYFDEPHSISIIEWGNNIKEIIPPNAIYIEIELINENERSFSFLRK